MYNNIILDMRKMAKTTSSARDPTTITTTTTNRQHNQHDDDALKRSEFSTITELPFTTAHRSLLSENTCTAASNVTCIDPFADQSTPLRESMRGRHPGVEINVQILSHQKTYFMAKIGNFEKLTGARINVVDTDTSKWFFDLTEDINGAGFIDLYSTFGNWVPTFVDQGGFKDITEEVSKQPGLDWFDIMPAVRKGVATYEGKVYSVPLDGDVIISLHRQDLVEDVGLPTPKTWDDVELIMKYYEDKPEYYTNCFSTAEDDIAGRIFWSIAATFLQTQGTSEGVFFDPDTMDPVSGSKARKDSFKKLLDFYKLLAHSSPYRDLGPTDWKTTLKLFQEGRCVLWFNYPGPTRILISNQESNNMTGVLDYAPLPGMTCPSSDDVGSCPHAINGTNYAPFLASGGMTFAVNNKRSSVAKQRAAMDFCFYVADPAVSFWDVAVPGSFLDPLRQRHTVALLNKDSPEGRTFLEYGWEVRQLEQLKTVTEFNFINDNFALDLRVLGAMEYLEGGTMPYLLKHWSGNFSTTEETAAAITDKWNEITTKYGLIAQRNMYRQILGLQPYIEPPTSTVPYQIIIPVICAIALIITILLGVVLKQRHTIKYKTRDVNDAPKTGTVALIFTDVEGSTSIWDTSKSVMSKALETHHNVVRKAIQMHKAYEVKTIGDAFMIAVGSANQAVLIANDIQKGLLEAEWPIELAAMPSACIDYFPPNKRNRAEPPQLMFKGLRVRIGIHLGTHDKDVEEGGEVQIEYDKVTKGYDYYGPVANASARIEALGFGGQTIISEQVFNQLSLEVKDNCAISAIGKMELRGVSGEVFLYQCLPPELKGRCFKGVLRRRTSDESTNGSTTSSFKVQSIHTTADMTKEIPLMNPMELQQTVARLRRIINQMSATMDEGNQIRNSEVLDLNIELPQSEIQPLAARMSTVSIGSDFPVGENSEKPSVRFSEHEHSFIIPEEEHEGSFTIPEEEEFGYDHDHDQVVANGVESSP